MDSLLDTIPLPQAGQHINLTQVTRTAKIDRFVNVTVFFDAPQGPVQLTLEAYVMKGMSTPFILGNNFQDQFSLFIVRAEATTETIFGDSGCRLLIENSTTLSLLDEGSHAFNIIHKGTTPLGP